MSVDERDREAYEKGREDYEKGTAGAVFDAVTFNIARGFDYGYSGSQLEAYRKGLSGKHLDEE